MVQRFVLTTFEIEGEKEANGRHIQTFMFLVLQRNSSNVFSTLQRGEQNNAYGFFSVVIIIILQASGLVVLIKDTESRLHNPVEDVALGCLSGLLGFVFS